VFHGYGLDHWEYFAMASHAITLRNDSSNADQVTIDLAGRITIEQNQELYEDVVLAAEGSDIVLIDCQQTEHLDWSSFQILHCLKKHLHREGKAFHVLNEPAGLADLFRLSGILDDCGSSKC
jgi:anti-anti-sigma regulatory factor